MGHCKVKEREKSMTLTEFVTKHGTNPPDLNERQLEELIRTPHRTQEMIQWRFDVIEFYRNPHARHLARETTYEEELI